MDILYVIIGKLALYKKRIFHIIPIFILFGILLFLRLEVKADVWNDAEEYYNTYGNSAVFNPSSKTNGNIYFCSAGNSSASGTKYKTVGYKVSVKNNFGNIIETSYFKFYGQYMYPVSVKKAGGKEYILNRITLKSFKNKLSTNTSPTRRWSYGSCVMPSSTDPTTSCSTLTKGNTYW